MPFSLLLQTPERQIYSGLADVVALRTEVGHVEILPESASLQGVIDHAVVRIAYANHEESYIVRYGFVFVRSDRASILVYECKKQDEMDVKSLREYTERILSQLEKADGLNPYQVRFLEEQRGSLEKMLLIREGEDTSI